MDEISDEQLMRYARHVIMEEVGESGQIKLLQSKVLVIGAGGLGSPVLMYLAAAGVGTLGIVDDDFVDITNLQRQIVHGTEDIDRPKVFSAADRIKSINPEIEVHSHKTRIQSATALELLLKYDVVLDGSDNFETRYMINDTCFFGKKTLISAALLRFEGQLTTIKAHEGGDAPCYRCIFPQPPSPGLVPRCEQAGIFGSVAGVLGTMQATEALKELLGIGRSLSGRLVLYDALSSDMRTLTVKKDSMCPLCGDDPTIQNLGVSG